MVFEIHLNIDVAYFLRVKLHLHFLVGLDVPEPSELVEMSTESVSRVVKCLVASTDETASLYEVVPLVEGRSGEVLIDRMDLEPLEGVYWGNGVLPDIPNHIIEVASLEEVDRVG